MSKTTVPAIRGLLIHMSHYDPSWFANKKNEKPFDLQVGLEVIDAMAASDLNLLIIACSDGVKYASHPELERHYSVPMRVLRTLAQRAQKHGIEVVPKLNFSQSSWHHHNEWFRPHNQLFDSTEYWRMGMQVADEVIRNTNPRRFFHVGMDEDHDRSYAQYADAINTLHKALAKRHLRPVVWNDSSNLWPSAMIHAEKAMYAEKRIPRDVVEIVWDYGQTRLNVLKRVVREGFETWVAPNSNNPGMIMEARQFIKQAGAHGILLTRWQAMNKGARAGWLSMIETAAPMCNVEI